MLPFAEHLDMILVMSVHPGFGGQEFIPAALDKLRYIRRELKRRGLSIDVEIDGGVKLDNIADVKAAAPSLRVGIRNLRQARLRQKSWARCAT